ncbi:MAG: hypothetical protein SFY32_01815 [Bacteroidota bacterium]|nr:hypothetical protein [Bacteroidota bacterium]
MTKIIQNFNQKRFIVLILCNLVLIKTYAQSNSDNYVLVKGGIQIPMGSFASPTNVNVVKTYSQIASSSGGKVNGGLLLPATSGYGLSIQANHSIINKIGLAVNAGYANYGSDASAASKSSEEIVSLLSGPLLTSLIGSQLGGSGAGSFLNNSGTSIKTTFQNNNWQLYSVLLGPSISLNSGNISLGVRAQAGFIYFTSPEVTANLDLTSSFFSTSILKIKQASVSKAIFATQLGLDIRYHIMNNLGIMLYNDFLFTPSTSFDTEITYEVPIAALLGNTFQTPTSLKSSNNISIQSWNTGVGVFYQFEGFNTKNKSISPIE